MIQANPIQGPSYSGMASDTRKTMRLIQDIRVVTALPATPDPTVTYLVGAQNTIPVSGLDGNTMQSLNVIADIINPAGGDSLILRFNGVTSNVYDYRFSYAGSTSTTAAPGVSFMAIGPTSGSGSLNRISMNVNTLAGINRGFISFLSQGGVIQQQVAGMLLSSGVWRDSSTNITSMTFGYASITGGFGVGTVIRIFALV